MFMPFQVLGMFLRGVISIAILACGVGLLSQWYKHRERVVVERVSDDATNTSDSIPNEQTRTRVVRWRWGANRETAFLVGGIAFVVWSLGGGLALHPLLWKRAGKNQGNRKLSGEIHRLKRIENQNPWLVHN